MIVKFEGKKYKRRGHCKRCGTCCTGFVKPCPQLYEDPIGVWNCKIHDILNSPHALELSKRNETVCNPPGAYLFPESPHAIKIVEDVCGFYFVLVEEED